MKALILTLILTACGTEYLPPPASQAPERYIDPYLAPTLKQFMADAHFYGHSNGRLSELRRLEFIDYDKLNPKDTSYLGLCKFFLETGNNVRRTWSLVVVVSDLEPCVQKYVTYHELGHAIYGAEHSNDPENMMYPYIETDPEECPVTWEKRVRVLFGSI